MEQAAIIPSLDTWTTVFLLSAVHGFVLSFLLFQRKKGARKANLWLGTFILLFALTLVDYVGYWSGYNVYFPHLRGFYEFFVLLFGPLLVFYFKTLNGSKVQLKHAWHLLPALLFFVLKTGLAWQMYFPSQIAYLNLEALLFVGHLSAYAVISGLYLRQLDEEKRKPQLIFLWLFWGFIAGWVSYFVLLRTPYFELFYDYLISLAMTVFIYAVGYLGLRRPDYFVSPHQKTNDAPKYQNSTLTKQASASIAKKLLEHLQSKKPYLENDLRIGVLAEQIEVSVHQLSQVLNEELGKNFSELVNDYRLEEAKRLLSSPLNQHLYIIDISYQAGFNNKTTFNKLFKKCTGLAPSSFRKKQLAKKKSEVPVN